MSFVFLTDLERIEALYRFRISCSDPRCRNIFILHSRKKKDNRRNVWTVRKKHYKKVYKTQQIQKEKRMDKPKEV